MRVLLLATLALLTACQSVTPLPPLPAWQGREGLQHADLGMIRDLRSGATLTPAQLVEQLADAPRVLIANSNLVPHWATWAHFNELDRKGLMMYGQMTAGSWIYIGTQGILQGTYETFAELARQHFGNRRAVALCGGGVLFHVRRPAASSLVFLGLPNRARVARGAESCRWRCAASAG